LLFLVTVRGVDGCLACDLAEGRLPLPGGVIHESPRFLVEHCVGPLGVGTLLVKPRRHVTRVGQLTPDEAAELGRLLQRSAAVIDALVGPEQVYTCQWSHAGRMPGHLHWVVQPATTEDIDATGAYGPGLQVRLFERGEQPPVPEVEAFAERARVLFA
jgi:diadenosine tetraphosphate (Ap4A) HIT family hydrolase